MPTASEQIAGRIREKIVHGVWAPGSRLPKRAVLIRELDSSAVAIQEAMDQLVAEGFIEVAARRLGTRVAPYPPHLSRYRLIFPFGPKDWGQFWHALEAAAVARTTPAREFTCFYGLGGHRSIADFQAVVNEVRTRSVAGLIFASSADELVGTPLLDAPGVPRVAITDRGYLRGIPKAGVDLGHFIHRAVALLAAQGRRRLALLSASRAPQMIGLFQSALAAYGLESPSHWAQFASMRNPITARHVMELLFHAGQLQRPDGLIVTDDNLLTSATEGIAATGIAVPRELEVVALTNFPNLLPAAVPVTRLGFDIPALLDLLSERLEQLRQGQTPPEYTTIASITASEFNRKRP